MFTNKNALKLMVSIVALLILLSVVTTISSYAAINGSLTFYHGENTSQKYTYAKTTSTAAENNMFFGGAIDYYSGPYRGQTMIFTSPIWNNSNSAEYRIYPGSVLGASLFDYWVDSTYQHTSTNWWDFDFR